jgi:hypothetical protein
MMPAMVIAPRTPASEVATTSRKSGQYTMAASAKATASGIHGTSEWIR